MVADIFAGYVIPDPCPAGIVEILAWSSRHLRHATWEPGTTLAHGMRLGRCAYGLVGRVESPNAVRAMVSMVRNQPVRDVILPWDWRDDEPSVGYYPYSGNP